MEGDFLLLCTRLLFATTLRLFAVRTSLARVTNTAKGAALAFETVDQVRSGLKGINYLADDGIAGVVYLAQRLRSEEHTSELQSH